MASVEDNHHFWNDRFQWGPQRGDQWSRNWGGPEAQWAWCVYPRIRQFLPAPNILEIGSGMGRWTRFLKDHCQKLESVDISERCVEVCRDRFLKDAVDCHLGDGRTLNFLEDNSVDFCFSFESLIHTELADLKSYLKELERTLRPGASCFLHHSNLGLYRKYYAAVARLPKTARKFLTERGFLDFDGWRASSVSYLNFRQLTKECGLTMVSQETVGWGGRRLIDCFSILRKGEQSEDCQYLENHNFVKRAAEIRDLSRTYGMSRW